MNGFEPCSERIYALVLLTRSIICNRLPRGEPFRPLA